MSEEKRTRTVDVGFTKIGDDVIVPSWRAKGGDGFSFRESAIIWWGLGIFWLSLLLFTGIDGWFDFVITTAIVFVAGLSFYFFSKLPEKWIELSRKDGSVSVWTSRKKRRLIGKWHIDQVDIKMSCRWISSGPKGQTSEHRYLIELFDNNPSMKKTSFWKFDNHPKKKGVPFFVLFDLFGDPHSFTEESDFALASATTHQVEKIARDFVAGRPIPESSTSTYAFSTPHNEVFS